MKVHLWYILGILINAIAVAMHWDIYFKTHLWISGLFVIINGICVMYLMDSYYKFFKDKE